MIEIYRCRTRVLIVRYIDCVEIKTRRESSVTNDAQFTSEERRKRFFEFTGCFEERLLWNSWNVLFGRHISLTFRRSKSKISDLFFSRSVLSATSDQNRLEEQLSKRHMRHHECRSTKVLQTTKNPYSFSRHSILTFGTHFFFY